MKFYEVKKLKHEGEDIIISRTGYTGEDGFELYGAPAYIVKMWDKLMEAGFQASWRLVLGLPFLWSGKKLYGE